MRGLLRTAAGLALLAGTVAGAAHAATARQLGVPSAVRSGPGPTNLEHGKKGGVIRHAGAPVRSSPSTLAPVPAARGEANNTALNAGQQLTYHGGPVQHRHTIYLIFWAPPGYSFPAGYQAGIEQFEQDVAADSHKTSSAYGTISQYRDNRPGTYDVYDVTYGGSALDTTTPLPSPQTNPDCTGRSGCVVDEDLTAEIDAVRQAQGWSGGLETQFAIITPPGIVSCFGDGQDACSDNYFCAYHSYFAPPTAPSTPFIYLNIPNVPANYCHTPGGGAGVQPMPNGTWDTESDNLSHEQREAATDPLLDAWYDAAGYEADDKCIDDYGKLVGMTPVKGFGGALSNVAYNQRIGSGYYDTQLEWSNLKRGCYQMGPPKITSIAPASASTGQTVDVTGENFFFDIASSAPKVLFNGIASPNVTVTDGNHLTAEVPAGKTTGKITVKAVGGNTVSTQTFGQKPVVTSLSALSGYAGQVITVNGSGFFGVTSVKINGVSGTFSGVTVDGTQLKFTIPAAATKGPISVTTPGGTGTGTDTFVVLPHITSFTPSSATAGSSVTITGTGFGTSPVVTFAGSAGPAAVVSATPTKVVATVPSDAMVGQIAVDSGDGVASTSPSTPFKPKIKIIGFDAANYQAGNLVTVSGSNFKATGADPTLKLGTITVPLNGPATQTSLQFTIPDNAVTAALTATNAVGTASSLPNQVKVRPTILFFNPDSDYAGHHVILTGKTFVGITSVKFNGVAATYALGGAGTLINATIPAAATTGKISVTNAGGTTESAGTFTVLPHVSNVLPLTGVAGTNVTISGTGLGGTSVDFTGSPNAVMVSHTATSIIVKVPANATNGPVTVHTDAGDATSSQVFKPTMKISGFDQPNYQVGNVVTVNGSNFTANGPITAAKVGLVSVAPVSNVTPTSFQVTLPDNAVTGAMSATNGNGTVSSSPATVKVRPTVTGDPSPTHGPAGTPVTFNGKTFIGTTSVKFNGAAATFTVGTGGTSIKAMVPAAATTGKVSFTNAGGTTLTANDFTVDPKISSFTPTTGPTGTVVTVTGTGFGGADRVDFLGPTPASTTVSGTPTSVTPTSLKVAVPPGAQTGKIQVHTTSGLSPVSGGSFSVTWSVTSISPTFGGYGTDVTIQGIGLTGVTQVKFNGFAGAIQPGGTNTELHVKTPSSGDPAITGHVTVWKMAASVQAPQDFTLLAISSFTPNHGAPGDTIDITGHGFLPATSVKFNGTNAVPSVIDDGHISATVPDGATTGKISVTTPAGTVESTDTFTVDTPPPSTATLQINEVSPGSAGLVEFKATQSGSTDGLTFDLDGTTIAALPDITVAKDDFVLLHFDSTFTNESTSKTSCTDPSCKPGAWDVATSLTGFSTGAHVLTVGVSGTTDIQDAVAFADPAAGSSPTDFIDALQSVQSFFQWAPTDCGGDPCSDGTSPTAQGISADWSTVDATHTAQRINDADTNLKDDWHVATDTLGATNGP